MTTLHTTKSGLTLSLRYYGWPVGLDYRLGDGVNECSLGSERPLMNDDALETVFADYLEMKRDAEYCEEERETYHNVDDL